MQRKVYWIGLTVLAIAVLMIGRYAFKTGCVHPFAAFLPESKMVEMETSATAGGWNSTDFEVSGVADFLTSPVRISVEGLDHSAKGFDVDLIDLKTMRSVQHWVSVREFAETLVLEPGQYRVRVTNDANILRTLSARVIVTLYPSE